MLKPVHFTQALAFLPATQVNRKTGETEAIQYHYYDDPDGKFVISCFEISEEDLKKLSETKKLFLILPFKNQPPAQIQIESPFTPKILTNEN